MGTVFGNISVWNEPSPITESLSCFTHKTPGAEASYFKIHEAEMVEILPLTVHDDTWIRKGLVIAPE